MACIEVNEAAWFVLGIVAGIIGLIVVGAVVALRHDVKRASQRRERP